MCNHVRYVWFARHEASEASAPGGKRVIRSSFDGVALSHEDIEPLETGAWLRQLRKLASSLLHSEEALVRSLRQSFYLAQLTPRPLRHVVSCSLPEREFERLLESGELLSAALALVGDRLNYSLSRLEGGERIEAEVWFPAEGSGSTVCGLAPPFAVHLAWLQCLATLDERTDFTPLLAGLPGQRKSQSSRRPKSTEH